MARRASSKNELIKCEYCGEMYAASYKHCPFCNEDGTGRWGVDDEDLEEDGAAVGGKRLAGGGKRSGGVSMGGGQGPSVRRVISMVVSLALIIAAAGIVISIVRSLMGEGAPAASVTPTPAAQVSAGALPSTVPSAAPSDAVVPSSPVAASQPPAPVVTTPVANLTTPTSFKLNREDFTLDHAGETFQMKATYTPENAHGDITWKSSDPNVAAVSWNGVVTAVSQGTVTVTATVANVGEKTCIVRCNFKDTASTATTTTTTTTAAPAASTAPSSSGLKLNREDFTLARKGETWRLTVSGTSSAVTWTSSKPEVATVGADGTVTAVSKGTCNVTAAVDGVTLKCIVRCNFSE